MTTTTTHTTTTAQATTTTATADADTDAASASAKDQRTLSEVACDLVLVEHRLRDVRRWTPETARTHLDAALSNIATALDALHAECDLRTTSTRTSTRTDQT